MRVSQLKSLSTVASLWRCIVPNISEPYSCHSQENVTSKKNMVKCLYHFSYIHIEYIFSLQCKPYFLANHLQIVIGIYLRCLLTFVTIEKSYIVEGLAFLRSILVPALFSSGCDRAGPTIFKQLWTDFNCS